MAGPRPRVTAAVCAYNEASNIGRLLATLTERDGDLLSEVIVISSGSTDGTDEIALDFAQRCAAVRFLREEERRGKASAVNIALREAKSDIMLLVDADCLPDEGAIAALVAPFDAADVGGAGSRNMPVNGDEGWVAHLGALLWELHHQVNLRRPVLGGDIVAFRRVFEGIRASTVNDDYVIEAELRRRGLLIAYSPKAVVRMRVPTTLSELLRQRRRIAAGFQSEHDTAAMKSTQDLRLIASAVAAVIRARPAQAPWLAALVAVEGFARLSARLDARRRGSGAYTAWQPAESTKRPL
jgi:biofilm PGA synthesis N-glycosyltransferase PgaC